VFDPNNGDRRMSQYDYALNQLVSHPEGRQSVIYYGRPEIQWEWNDDKHAHHDFICTFCTQQFIRNGKLEYVVNMRSNDCITGTPNDL
jgi:thymidylate synthase